MESLHIQRGVRRVLFRTSNTDKRLMFKKEFDSSFAGFMTDGVKWLVENTDIKLIGLDYLSFAAFDESPATHKVILKGRVTLKGYNGGEAIDLVKLDRTWRLQYTSAPHVVVLFEAASRLHFFQVG